MVKGEKMRICELIAIFLIWLAMLHGLAGYVYGETAFDFGLTQSMGVIDREEVAIDYQRQGQYVYTGGSVRYAESAGDRTDELYRLKLSVDDIPWPYLGDWWPERLKVIEGATLWVFDEVARNDFWNVRGENYFGGGAKLPVFETTEPTPGKPHIKASISGGVLHHYADYQGETESATHSRISIRPKASWACEKWSVSCVMFYQPRIGALAENYILTGEASVGYELTEQVALKLKVEDEYRSVSHIDNNNSLRWGLFLSALL
jgi:hypothetical protein